MLNCPPFKQLSSQKVGEGTKSKNHDENGKFWRRVWHSFADNVFTRPGFQIQFAKLTRFRNSTSETEIKTKPMNLNAVFLNICKLIWKCCSCKPYMIFHNKMRPSQTVESNKLSPSRMNFWCLCRKLCVLYKSSEWTHYNSLVSFSFETAQKSNEMKRNSYEMKQNETYETKPRSSY